jgi:hypothetical protein
MSDLLAIASDFADDDTLADEIARRHPDRVTVLLEDREPDDRLALLIAKIERRTGAVVVGLAGSREQLEGWRFDRVVGGHAPLPV